MTAELRTCKKCVRTLPAVAFPRDQRSAAGHWTKIYTCRDCAALRRAVLRMHAEPTTRKRRVCRICGVDKPLRAFFMTNRGKRETQCRKCKAQRGTERRRQKRETDPVWADAYRARHAQQQARRRMERALQRLVARP